MRRILLIAALLLFAGIAFGQTLMKGNLIGVHVLSVELKPGATMDQFIDFCQKEYIPASEKIYAGLKLYIIKGVRGEHKNSLGYIAQFVDEASRDKYYNADGGLNELGKKYRRRWSLQ